MGAFDVLVQFCLTHLIRDVKILVSHLNAKHRRSGARVLQVPRDMFQLNHPPERLPWRLPGDSPATLVLATQCSSQFVVDPRLLVQLIGRFEWIRLQVVQFKRLEWTVA